MTLTILIVLIFLFALYGGSRRGLMMQLISTIFYLIVFYIATQYYPAVSEAIDLLIPYPSANYGDAFALYTLDIGFQLDTAFYNIIGFAIILIIGGLISRLIIVVLNPVQYITVPLSQGIDKGIGAFLSLILAYLFIFIGLFLLSTLPVAPVQNMIAESTLAQVILTESPYLSDYFYQLWIEPLNP